MLFRSEKEKGLFFLAAEKLLHDLSLIHQHNEHEDCNGNNENDRNKNDNEENSCDDRDRLFLRATACEIYLDDVYDILGPNKQRCALRVGKDGRLAVTREPKSEKLEGMGDSAIVTIAPGLRSIPVHRPEDLDEFHTS